MEVSTYWLLESDTDGVELDPVNDFLESGLSGIVELAVAQYSCACSNDQQFSPQSSPSSRSRKLFQRSPNWPLGGRMGRPGLVLPVRSLYLGPV